MLNRLEYLTHLDDVYMKYFLSTIHKSFRILHLKYFNKKNILIRFEQKKLLPVKGVVKIKF